ncbi:uncharacterized protein CCOS01_16935 [Colletotrichum costaricense]|uniref:Uncharacterized protein n=1 Tax=Colletotrichum costaricense TaxID=1209916 RepID=A0AAI9YEP4_9PEZI|nr:uncharacterized protein CCOS01_16935 [Colletotrichum costaricense]KAK1503860.1 hypothetical protein CCOS01_16935 [Colletotrichum costaricense]
MPPSSAFSRGLRKGLHFTVRVKNIQGLFIDTLRLRLKRAATALQLDHDAVQPPGQVFAVTSSEEHATSAALRQRYRQAGVVQIEVAAQHAVATRPRLRTANHSDASPQHSREETRHKTTEADRAARAHWRVSSGASFQDNVLLVIAYEHVVLPLSALSVVHPLLTLGHRSPSANVSHLPQFR